MVSGLFKIRRAGHLAQSRGSLALPPIPQLRASGALQKPLTSSVARCAVLQILPAPEQVQHPLQLGQRLVDSPAELSCTAQCSYGWVPGLLPLPEVGNQLPFPLFLWILGLDDQWTGKGFCYRMPLWEMMASGPYAVLGHSCPPACCGRVTGSRWGLESSPVALTMLSSRGRSEGGALWGRRYVKKNLGQRETRGSVLWPWEYILPLPQLGTEPYSGQGA